jgi:hypothetical protein
VSDEVAAAPDARFARALARHLVGADPAPEEAARWLAALPGALPLAQPRDRRLWALAQGAPWLLGPIDAGLAFVDPYSPVRQRIALMLAVLEASPHHLERFAARDLGALVYLHLAWHGVRAALRSALGLTLVGTWGLLWR